MLISILYSVGMINYILILLLAVWTYLCIRLWKKGNDLIPSEFTWNDSRIINKGGKIKAVITQNVD